MMRVRISEELSRYQLFIDQVAMKSVYHII